MLDLIKRQEKKKNQKKHGWWASGIIATLACVFVSARFPVCVWALACVSDLFPGTPRQGLWDASQHKKESVFIRAQTHVLPDASRHLEWLFFFPPLSGRSWEELRKPQWYKPKGQNETRCDKLLNSCHSVLHPFCLSLASALLWRKKKKKENSLQLPSFYNLGESLTTAISHDKVFN